MLQYISMNVAITGSSGLVGSALIQELDPTLFSVMPLDLPETDISNYSVLFDATKKADALIHLAWKDLVVNIQNDTSNPINIEMVRNVYEVAAVHGIRRIIMGSSNQAHGYDVRDNDGRIRPTTQPDTPTNVYGREKLLVESIGRQCAAEHGLEVVCLRIGNVNKDDRPKPTTDGRPQRWLSRQDLGRLVTACLQAKVVPDGFQIVYGVSEGSVFDWVNPFGYVPLDTAA
jgi:nucleoside-diphosphate-sugar epimerase